MAVLLVNYVEFNRISYYSSCGRRSYSKSHYLHIISRRTSVWAVNQNAEESFKKTVAVDRLIDMLRDANDKEVCLVLLYKFFSNHQFVLYH